MLKFIGEGDISYPEEMPFRQFKVFKFVVSDDYKNYIKWQRKEVIKGKH